MSKYRKFQDQVGPAILFSISKRPHKVKGACRRPQDMHAALEMILHICAFLSAIKDGRFFITKSIVFHVCEVSGNISGNIF